MYGRLCDRPNLCLQVIRMRIPEHAKYVERDFALFSHIGQHELIGMRCVVPADNMFMKH